MPYVDAVISESMRVHLTTSVMASTALKDVAVGGITVPKGTDVFVCQGKTAISDKYFTNAKQFWPEVIIVYIHTYSHSAALCISFSLYTRVCTLY
jgi:cytochrome P450